MIEPIKKRGRPKNSDSKKVFSSLLEKTLASEYHGRTNFSPTTHQRQMVIDAKAAGISDEEIAYMVRWPDDTPISVETLHKAFWDELNVGALKIKIEMANLCRRLSEEGSASALIFWLKCRAGWREPRDDDKNAQQEQAQLIAEAIKAVLKPTHE